MLVLFEPTISSFNPISPIMRYSQSIRLLTLLFVTGCQIAAADSMADPSHYVLSIVPDRADALYHTDDLVTFTVQLKKDGKPVDGADVKWMLSKDGVKPPIQEGDAILSNGQAVVT